MIFSFPVLHIPVFNYETIRFLNVKASKFLTETKNEKV